MIPMMYHTRVSVTSKELKKWFGGGVAVIIKSALSSLIDRKKERERERERERRA